MEEVKATKKKKKAKSITFKANKRGRHISKVLNFLRVLVLPIYSILKPYRFYGNRKAKDGACIFVSNHYGLFDPAYPASMTWEAIHFVAKKEVFKMPVISLFAKATKAISVNRDGNDVRGLLDCFKCLKNGEKICIYPEGTRNKGDENELLPFHSGAAMMAIRSKTPIVPILIYKKPRFFRCTHIIVGDPIELTEYYDRKLSEEEIAAVDADLRQHMLDMRQAHKEFLESKKKKKSKQA